MSFCFKLEHDEVQLFVKNFQKLSLIKVIIVNL